MLERRGNVRRFLREARELGIPPDGRAPVAEPVAHDPLVVVLAENENERVWTQRSPGLAQGYVGHLAPFRPKVCARAALAELERPLDDAELRVDLQRARLHPRALSSAATVPRGARR